MKDQPHFDNGLATIWHDDCLHRMRALPDSSIDAIVTDPPYGLANTDPKHVVETISRWIGGDREFLPTGAGFMGNPWDAFVPPPAVWDEALRVLKPGGHLLAFAGSRTLDLMGLSIRMAGFDIRDTISWLYGSGFPKSLDVAQAIDKSDAGLERLARAREFQSWLSQHMTPAMVNEVTDSAMGHHLTTHPTQPAIATAPIFDMLRPHIPAPPARIEELVAQRTVESQNYAAREVVGQHKTAIARGAAGVTAAGGGKARTRSNTEEAQQWEGWGTALKPAFEPIVFARKPLRGTVASNVLEHGTGALNIDANRIHSPGSEAKAYIVKRLKPGATLAREGGRWRPDGDDAELFEGETAAGRWPTNVILDGSQAAALDEQTGETSSVQRTGKRTGILGEFAGQDDATMGHSDSGGASRFFSRFDMTAEDWAHEAEVRQLPTFIYEAKAPTFERPEQGGVLHPTVKPLALMRHLVRLVTPPGGTVLEPFAGSGTTVEACMIEGFQVIAIEITEDYLPLIVKRISKDIQPTMFGDI